MGCVKFRNARHIHVYSINNEDTIDILHCDWRSSSTKTPKKSGFFFWAFECNRGNSQHFVVVVVVFSWNSVHLLGMRNRFPFLSSPSLLLYQFHSHKLPAFAWSLCDNPNKYIVYCVNMYRHCRFHAEFIILFSCLSLSLNFIVVVVVIISRLLWTISGDPFVLLILISIIIIFIVHIIFTDFLRQFIIWYIFWIKMVRVVATTIIVHTHTIGLLLVHDVK